MLNFNFNNYPACMNDASITYVPMDKLRFIKCYDLNKFENNQVAISPCNI